MTIDIFSTRAMLTALRERKPPKRFLTDTFFPTVDVSTSEYVDIDILSGRRRLAPFVTPVAEGKLVEHERHSTRSYKPPYVKPKFATKASDLLTRAIGQPVATAANLTQRAAVKLAEELSDGRDQVTRLVEWMAAQALNTGTINVVGEGVNETLDFLRPGAHDVVLVGTALWTDTGNSTPLQDVRDWRRLVAQASGLSPNVCVMGSSAADAFLKHPDVVARLDSRRNIAAEVTMDEIADGATYIGRIDNVDYWEYDEWYEDDAGTLFPMVPVDRVWLGNRNARTSQLYGAIQDFDALGFSGPIFAKSWIEKDPSVRYVLMQSAPLIGLHQSGAFLAATVV